MLKYPYFGEESGFMNRRTLLGQRLLWRDLPGGMPEEVNGMLKKVGRLTAAAPVLCSAFILLACSRQDMSRQDLDLQMLDQTSAPQISTFSTTEQPVLRLPVSDDGNRNPFAAAGAFPGITPLLYESLYHLDENYQPQPLLAAGISLEEQNTVCTVALRPDARFSDGSIVTAADVVASLQEAIKYPAAFSTLSQIVQSCRVQDDAVVITLLEPERNVASLLTFPVCKAGTQSSATPVGSGPFVCGSVNAARLTRNNYYSGDPLTLQSVELIPVSDRESLEYMLKIGAIDFYFSSDTASDTYSYGSSEYITLNRLTYLGVNRQTGSLLSNDALWQLIRSAMQKEQLVSYACGNTAQVTDIPFHPGFWQKVDAASFSIPEEHGQGPDGAPAPDQTHTDASSPALEELMRQFGYLQRDEEGYWIRNHQGNSYRFTLKILVNTENTARHQLASLLSEQLAETGIELQIVSEPYAAYLAAVASRQFDLYVGEVQIGPNMDLSYLFTEEHAAQLGLPYHAQLLEASKQLKSGEITYDDFLEVFDSCGVMEPLYYKRGSINYSRNLTPGFITAHRDLLLQLQWY